MGERITVHGLMKYPLELHAEGAINCTARQSRKPTVNLAVYNEVHFCYVYELRWYHGSFLVLKKDVRAFFIFNLTYLFLIGIVNF